METKPIKQEKQEPINELKLTYKIHNWDILEKFFDGIKGPMYFLDFEAITFAPIAMAKNNLDLDQQLFSFSFLKVDNFADLSEKPRHYNFVGKKLNYNQMASELSRLYVNYNAKVFVWGAELEFKGLAKLIGHANQNYKRKLGSLIGNVIDLQVLFRGQKDRIVEISPLHQNSLSFVAKAVTGSTIDSSLNNGKKTNYVLKAFVDKKTTAYHQLKNIDDKLTKYNNSDVIHIKRILFQLHRDLLAKKPK